MQKRSLKVHCTLFFNVMARCKVLRRLLLEAYGDKNPLTGGKLTLYVFDIKFGTRRLFRRRDLTKLYHLLLSEGRSIARRVLELLPNSPPLSSNASELVQQYVDMSCNDVEYATRCEAPNMPVNVLLHNCWCVFRNVTELREILEDLSSGGDSSAAVVFDVPLSWDS